MKPRHTNALALTRSLYQAVKDGLEKIISKPIKNNKEKAEKINFHEFKPCVR